MVLIIVYTPQKSTFPRWVVGYGTTDVKTGSLALWILFFNPGSPTDRMFAPYNALGLLELSDTITGTLIRL